MKRLAVLGAMAMFALVVTTSDASAATLYSQSNILRGNDTGLTCSGGSRGTCKINEVGAVGTSSTASDNIQVKCAIKSAPANTTFEVFWTCTNTARGCHDQACGFISLGFVTTNGLGKGSFTATKGNNPFLGKYVHLDLIGGGQTYAAVYAGIPIGVGPAIGTNAGQPGDPTSR